MLRVSLLLLAALIAVVSSMGVPMQDCDGGYTCPKGFKDFKKRKNGPWCVKLIPGNVTWWEAERECRCSTKGATLSGIETTAEKKWLEENGQALLDKQGIKNGAIWIGAYRRKDCPSGNQTLWSKNPLCSDEKMFQFTDRHTCGTLIFQDWNPTSASGDDCGVMTVSTDNEGTNADKSGKAADKNCQQVQGSSEILNSVGFLCGVKPVQNGGGSSYGGGDEIIVIGAGKPDKKH